MFILCAAEKVNKLDLNEEMDRNTVRNSLLRRVHQTETLHKLRRHNRFQICRMACNATHVQVNFHAFLYRGATANIVTLL